MIKAVIIDFDDTLCMTEEASFYLENEILKAIDATPMSCEIHKSTWGKQLFEAIEVRSPGVDVAKFRAALEEMLQDWVSQKKIDAVERAA